MELLPQKDVGVTLGGVGKTCCGKEWVASTSLHFSHDDDTIYIYIMFIRKNCTIHVITVNIYSLALKLKDAEEFSCLNIEERANKKTFFLKSLKVLSGLDCRFSFT